MNIEVGRKKYYLHKRYTEFLMLHQVRPLIPDPVSQDQDHRTQSPTPTHLHLCPFDLTREQKLCEQQYPEIEDFDFPGKVRASCLPASLLLL